MKEPVFDSVCRRGLSAEAALATMLKTPPEAESLITESQNQTPMNKTIHYLGLDVHKVSIPCPTVEPMALPHQAKGVLRTMPAE